MTSEMTSFFCFLGLTVPAAGLQAFLTVPAAGSPAFLGAVKVGSFPFLTAPAAGLPTYATNFTGEVGRWDCNQFDHALGRLATKLMHF